MFPFELVTDKPTGVKTAAWEISEVIAFVTGMGPIQRTNLFKGLVDAYVHFNNTVGVLVEVNCETDFVANTDDFKQLVKDIALHIASPAAPRFLRRDEAPEAELDQVRHAAQVQAKESGKPDHVIDTIIEGKVNAYVKDIVLLEQPFVKDDSKTVQQLLDETSAKVGERIAVRRFARFKLGEAGDEDAGDGGPGAEGAAAEAQEDQAS